MFRCDLLIEDDVLVVATGEGEELEREWLVESVIEACGSAAALRAMIVVDVRHAWFDQGLEKAVEEIMLFCANHGVSVRFRFASSGVEGSLEWPTRPSEMEGRRRGSTL